MEIKWKSEVDLHDYAAAADYLELIYPWAHVSIVVEKLKSADLTSKKAKDIIRASGSARLGKKDPSVAGDLKKIKKGEMISPILLVRVDREKLIIADGFHRTCAAYLVDENTEIPCKLVSA